MEANGVRDAVMQVANGADLAGDMESVINRVQGVVSSRVLTGNGAGVEEVHVLARVGRSPKQIVRDVESVCAALFGLTLDHRRISVAQLEEPATGAAAAADARLRFFAVHAETTGERTLSRVQLQAGDALYEGEASGSVLAADRLRLAAGAALQAVEEYLAAICRFVLEDVVLVPLGGRELVVVALTMVAPFGEEDLLGSGTVRQDADEAAVRAVLNAINRRLTNIDDE